MTVLNLLAVSQIDRQHFDQFSDDNQSYMLADELDYSVVQII